MSTNNQGRIQDFGLEGARSSAEGARIEAPNRGGVWGSAPSPEKFE